MEMTNEWVGKVADEIPDPEITALGLTGSHATGDAIEFSDVDISRFAKTLPHHLADRSYLKIVDGFLVSCATTSIEAKKEELTKSASAIWAVPGLRKMRIVRDRDGELGGLIDDAKNFEWAPLQTQADSRASRDLCEFVEEAHNIMRGMSGGDKLLTALTLMWFVLGMTKVVAVHRGVMIDSDNTYFAQVQDSVGQDSPWSQNHRAASGVGTAHLNDRARAEISLFVETARLIDSALLPEHREVTDHTLALIDRTGLTG